MGIAALILAAASIATKVTTGLIQQRNALQARKAMSKNQQELIRIETEIMNINKKIQKYNLGITKAEDAKAGIYRNSALALGGAAVLSAYVYFQK